MSTESVFDYCCKIGNNVVRATKCGDGPLAMVPAICWTIGTLLLAHSLTSTLFRSFLFRRVPLWEAIIQDMVFLWLVVYGLRVWALIVDISNTAIQHYSGASAPVNLSGTQTEEKWLVYFIQQMSLWILGVTPLATTLFIMTRPRNSSPLIIWIAASPWHRREMGPQGYYLNRPLAVAPSTSTNPRNALHRCLSQWLSTRTLRRCHSDSDVITTHTPMVPRRRRSKSC